VAATRIVGCMCGCRAALRHLSMRAAWCPSVPGRSRDVDGAASYCDRTTKDLRFALKDGLWQAEAVDVSGDVGEYTALAIGADGRRNISYFNEGQGAMRYAG